MRAPPGTAGGYEAVVGDGGGLLIGVVVGAALGVAMAAIERRIGGGNGDD